MTETKYTYSIAGDFPNQVVNSSRLTQEIEGSAIVIVLSYIGTVGDVCDIWFRAELSSGDEAILDALIAAHSGAPLPASPQVVTTPIVAADGTPVFTGRELTLGQLAFTRVDNGSESIAINGIPSGAATILWNGTGAEDTGGDWTVSGVGSETAGSMHSGTNGWDTGVVSGDDEVIFTGGADLDPGSYGQVSFWLQPKAFPCGSKIYVRWSTVAGSNKGKELKLKDYVTNFDLDVWQKVTIPMTDFDIDGADEVGKLKFRFHKSGQRAWFDDVELRAEGGDGPFVFRVAPAEGVGRYRVSMVSLVLSGDNTGWDATSFANISALSSGLLLRHRRLSTSEVLWSFNSKDNVDLLGRYVSQGSVTFADDTLLVNLILRSGLITSIVLTEDDVLELVVRDDLIGLGTGRAYVHYGVEEAV